MNKKLLFIIATVMLFSLVVFSGCDKRVTDLDDIVIAAMNITPSHIDIGDTTKCYVNVLVEDDDGFAVTNTKVLFKATEGSLNPASIYTDSSGVAKVEFDYSLLTGNEESIGNGIDVEAFVISKDSGINALRNISVGSIAVAEVRSLVFEETPISLQVQGTGGAESSDLNVYIRDFQGELITEPKEISFQFVNGPEGIKLNNHEISPDGNNEIVTVTSQNGIATVSISSGMDSGGATIKAFLLNMSGETILASKSNIIVQAGPPNSVEYIMDGFNNGIDIGAGTWKVEIGALITDIYGNPVGDGTSVFFYIVDPDDEISFASLETEFCYVGNENADGDTLAGAAFTFLDYDGTHTNDAIEIMVEVGNVEFSPETIILPLQNPSIDMVLAQQYIAWTEDDNPPQKSMDLHLIVVDGQQNRINNQNIHFNSTLGYFVEQQYPPVESGYYNLPAHYTEGITGYVEDETGMDQPGRLIKTIWVNRYECPPPIPSPPGTITVTITATILGDGAEATVTLILYRYVE